MLPYMSALDRHGIKVVGVKIVAFWKILSLIHACPHLLHLWHTAVKECLRHSMGRNETGHKSIRNTPLLYSTQVQVMPPSRVVSLNLSRKVPSRFLFSKCLSRLRLTNPMMRLGQKERREKKTQDKPCVTIVSPLLLAAQCLPNSSSLIPSLIPSPPYGS